MGAPGDAENRTPYPILEPEQSVRLNAALVEIIASRYAGRLTEAQLSVLRTAVEQQTKDAEALHHVPLTNADEPVFIRPANEAGQR